MIKSTFSQKADFENLPLLQKAIETVSSMDLSSLKKGRNEVEGDDIYINVMEYQTTDPENRIWEAHRGYLDVHFVIEGKEYMQINPLSKMNCQEYQPESDYVPMTGPSGEQVLLQQGEYIVCFPEDAHKTGIKADDPQTIRKAVMKVRIA
jgi:YhcH/YjgK/YiaL family protein